MDEDRILEYIIKKEMLVKEVSLFNSSKYYSFTNKIQIYGENEIDILLSFLHEVIHFGLCNTHLCILSADFANLFNYLQYFYVLKKTEIFETYEPYTNIKDVHKKIMYMMSYTHELDMVLAKDNKFVDYCIFCVEIFNTFIELEKANEVFNEGLATYYSLNVVPQCPFFECMGILDILELAFERMPYDEILNKQNEIKRKILSTNNWGLYSFSYRYTKLLIKIYGENYFLSLLLKIISSKYDIYGYDLISLDLQERKDLIHNKLSYTTMYYNLILNADKILPITSKEGMTPYNPTNLFELITNNLKLLNKDLTNKEIINSLNIRFFKHPKVVKAIETMLNRKITVCDYNNAFVYSTLKRSGESQYALFEQGKVQVDTNNILKQLKQNDSIIISKNEKYAERHFVDTYNGMREIISIAKGK